MEEELLLTNNSYDVPLLRGYLTKQKKNNGWNKYWYQNSHENPLILQCFAEEKSTKVLEVIDFSQVSELKLVRTNAEDSSKKKYGFTFKHGKTTQRLLVTSEEEGEYWKQGISALIRIVNGSELKRSKKEKDKLRKSISIKKDHPNALGLYPGESFATTLIDFYSTDEGVLSFRKGEIIIIIGKPENGWIPVEFGGKRGWVPNEFIKVMDEKQ